MPIISPQLKIGVKMRGKIRVIKRRGLKQPLKIRYLVTAFAVVFGAVIPKISANAEHCPNLKIVFARGSGGELNNDPNYLEFKSRLEEKLKSTSLDYEFIDLDYPAVGVGADNLDVTIGAYVGAGEAYEFGESVKSGVKKLDKLVNSSGCKNAKYVLGGYSQGAMVISKSLKNLDANKIIYAATFGDPKLYLPEGEGSIPAACYGENLSDYRVYVPDCHAYKGLLGAYIPYEPKALIGKVGTWCNRNDIFCSSHFNINDHVSYVEDGLYEDASRIIFDKIAQTFEFENQFYSPHDTAIVIDSTGSMGGMIEKYKAEAFRLAKETLDAGGRVALYDYRDLDDPYTPVKHCDFETCTLEIFSRELDEIQIDGGGDEPESLLSASFHVMESLNWQRGATKSLVVLTDAGFLSPDRDGISFADAVRLSKTIDPVNFYIITEPENEELYQELAVATDGKVVTNFENLSLLTDFILERYDSLPRVEEEDKNIEKPILTVNEMIRKTASEVEINFSNTGQKTIVILNDKILGMTEDNIITIKNIDSVAKNTVTLVPLSDDVRGEGVDLELSVPKAPDTGKAN